MTDYVKITPNGHTFHLPSSRIKKFGAVERPITFCGLWIHTHSVTEALDEPPKMLCPVCRKRSSQLDLGGA